MSKEEMIQAIREYEQEHVPPTGASQDLETWSDEELENYVNDIDRYNNQ